MTQAKVEAVNKLLLAGEPGNISTDEHASYASTGYKPQFIIDAMNEIFWGEWGFSEIGSEVVSGDKGPLVVSQVQVWLAGIEFRPTSWGQNRVTSGNVGDAKKGAQTDAIKKALSYFSIGNRAYLGLLVKEEEQGNQNGNRRVSTAPRTLPRGQQAVPGKPDPIQAALGKHCDRARFLGLITSDEQWWPWLVKQGIEEVKNGADLKKVNDALVAVENSKKKAS